MPIFSKDDIETFIYCLYKARNIESCDTDVKEKVEDLYFRVLRLSRLPEDEYNTFHVVAECSNCGRIHEELDIGAETSMIKLSFSCPVCKVRKYSQTIVTIKKKETSHDERKR